MTSIRGWLRPAAALAAGAIAVSTLSVATPAHAVTVAQPSQLVLDWAGEAGGTLGYSASRVSCDVNGDGLGDTVTGDWGWDRPGYTNTGAGYVLLGSRELAGGAAASGGIANPGSGAIRIDGPAVTVTSGAWIGWASTCLGDVNGDGYDDIALGSGSTRYHKIVVVLGRSDFGAIDLSDLGTNGFWIEDTSAGDHNFGYWVGEVGDVNGDGLADIGIGDILADYNGRTNSGRVWVVAGSDSVADVDVATQASTRVLRTIDGAAAEDRLGTVATAGDVNGDHIDDLVVSSYTATPWGSASPVAGAAYVVHGATGSTLPAIDLSTLGNQGFAIWGGQRARDRLGTAVAPAGDVNRDGLADVLVGGDGVYNAATGDRNGGVAVVYGSASTATVFTAPEATSGYTVFSCEDGEVDLTCAASGRVNRGYWINGAAANSKAGWAVAGLGDVNGDQIPDALIGADGGTKAVWVVYGASSRSVRKVELTGLTAAQGWKVVEGFSRSVGAAGDVDGNGTPDLLAGNNTANKAVTILLGPLTTAVELATLPSVSVGGSATITATAGARLPGARSNLAGTLRLERNGASIPGCADLAVAGSTQISCTLTDLAAGDSTITASFVAATSGYQAATDAAALTVAKHPVVIGTPALSHSRALVGTERITVSALLTNATGAPLAGAATLHDGASAIATVAIAADGTASFILPASLAAGTHKLSVTRASDQRYASGSSATSELEVVKAQLVKKPAVSASSVAKGAKPKVTVRLSKLETGQFPAGKVRIRYAGATIKVKLKARDEGRLSVKLTKKATKTRTAKVKFLGSATQSPSTTIKIKIRVR